LLLFLIIKKDDIIKINPGETIPADGLIIKGSTTVNQSLITGESLPVDKTVDDEIYAGTINNYGQIIVKVTTDGQSNSLQKLISLINRRKNMVGLYNHP
jgi:P-type Cu+ transporter